MKFSVGIMVYKELAFIGDLLERLEVQEQFISEVVILNDSPADLSDSHFTKYLDNRGITFKQKIVVMHNSSNLGVLRSFKKLTQVLENDHVLIIGADDNITTNYFATMTDEIYANPCKLAWTPNQYRIDRYNKIIGKSKWTQKNLLTILDAVRAENFGVPSAGSVYHKDLLIKLNSKKNMINEDEQVIFLAQSVDKRKIVNERIFFYRIDESSLSSWLRKPFISNDELYNTLLLEFSNRISQNLLWQDLALSIDNEETRNGISATVSNNVCRYQKLISLIRPSSFNAILIHYRLLLLKNFMIFKLKKYASLFKF